MLKDREMDKENIPRNNQKREVIISNNTKDRVEACK